MGSRVEHEQKQGDQAEAAAAVWVSNDGGWKHVPGISRVCTKAKLSCYSSVSWRQSSFRGHTDLGYTLSESFVCDLKTGIKTPD